MYSLDAHRGVHGYTIRATSAQLEMCSFKRNGGSFNFSSKFRTGKSAMTISRGLKAVCVLALLFAGSCASTKVSDRQQLESGNIARPNNIWVYDFVATPGEVPGDSSLAGQYSQDAPQTAEQIEIGHQLGVQIAQELVAQIQGMGLPAQEATIGTTPQIGDIVIRGYLVSINQGSEIKRLAIGFGSGASELKTVVEGYEMTQQGLRKLGSGTVDAGGAKGPGAAVPLAVAIATGNPIGLIVSSGIKVYGEASGRSKVEGRAKSTAKEIADQLKVRFQQQGWIA